MPTDPADCGFCVLMPGLRAGHPPTPAQCPIHGAEPAPADPTPIPADNPARIEIATAFIRSGFYDSDDIDLLQWQPCSTCPSAVGKCGCSGVPYISDAIWAKLGPAVAKIRAAGLAAGRAASGCCQAAVDSDGHTHFESCVYLLGLREGRVEGRTAAAADLDRTAAALNVALHYAKPTADPASVEELSGCRIALEMAGAARVAENGAPDA